MLKQLLLVLALWLSVIRGGAEELFVAGADMSLLPFFESRGVIYRADGLAQDALQLLRSRGLNCVRLRLFTSSPTQAAADPYNRINNLDYTLPLALRVKQAGLRFLLDFHYSDTWADPGHQTKPAAWQGLDLAGLLREVRAYSSNSMAAFRGGRRASRLCAGGQ